LACCPGSDCMGRASSDGLGGGTTWPRGEGCSGAATVSSRV
jgi:hypothetical protein